MKVLAAVLVLMVLCIDPLDQSVSAETPRTVAAVSSELSPAETESIVEMANQAAIAWGHEYPLRLRVVAGNPRDYPDGTVAFAGPGWPSGEPPSYEPTREWDCLLGVLPGFWEANVFRAPLIAHEIGHCLGFDHSGPVGVTVMNAASGVTDWDRARYRALWGLPVANSGPGLIVIGGLSAE